MRFWYRCAECGAASPFRPEAARCGCGGSLLVEYDLEWAARAMNKERLLRREASMWRYAELLPAADPARAVSLGEGWTPLVRLVEAERRLPLGTLRVKREEQNPTGSFKARGFSVAVTLAKEGGAGSVAVNSNGNAASALAAYAARAGMEAHVFLPKDVPGLIAAECVHYGARTYLVDGFIHDAGSVVEAGRKRQGWKHLGTLKEPGRAEGKKTMGLELAEQLGWRMPDVIVYPTGGGSGIVGMWNAFRQLAAMGFVHGELTRLVCVQEIGCDPIVQAVRGGGPARHSGPVLSNPTGMRVPDPPDGRLIARIVRETGGTAISVSAEAIRAGQRELGRAGISASPEGGAAWAGMIELLDAGWIRPKDAVVLFNTAHAMKYWPHPLPNLPVVSTYEDWERLRSAQTN